MPFASLAKEQISGKLPNIAANKIRRDSVDRYIRSFPDSTFRNYYEMELDDVLA